MPFAWYYPDVPTQYSNAGVKANAMYESELRTRAILLMGLGYSQEETQLRLKGNVAWDFELHSKPAHLSRVITIVEQVYATRGACLGGSRSGGTPSP
jgi:hypothetical protein